jgi:hypothetical protein
MKIRTSIKSNGAPLNVRMYFEGETSKADLVTREDVREVSLEAESPGNGTVLVELHSFAGETKVVGTMEVLVPRGKAERPENQPIWVEYNPKSRLKPAEQPQFTEVKQISRSKLRFRLSLPGTDRIMTGNSLHYLLLDGKGNQLSGQTLRFADLRSGDSTECEIIDPYVGQATTVRIIPGGKRSLD